MIPLVNEPPTQAIAAIPIGRPVRPSIAVSAMELSGEVHIIFMIPPSKKPITIGDWSVAALMVPPIRVRRAVTAGSTVRAMMRARGAMISAPPMILMPSGSFFSITGAISPIR